LNTPGIQPINPVQRQHRRRRNGFAALALGGAGVFLLLSPFGPSLARLSYDFPFLLWPPLETNNAVVVLMDEASRLNLRQPGAGPWDRSLHTKLVRELTDRGANGIVFDILFDEPWQDPAVDLELGAAIRRHGRVVLAASCSYTRKQNSTFSALVRAIEPIGATAAWGVVELPLDADSAIRRHPNDPHYPSLAWQAAALLGRAPTDRLAARWINCYGMEHTIPQVSYSQVLEPHALPADFFRQKTVFVGAGPLIGPLGGAHADKFRAACSRWTGMTLTGVEIHAGVFTNLVRRDWLKRLPLILELLAIWLFGCASVLALSRLRSWLALLGGAGLVLAPVYELI
jgi:CHASE2 domain-containing sensor protein